MTSSAIVTEATSYLFLVEINDRWAPLIQTYDGPALQGRPGPPQLILWFWLGIRWPPWAPQPVYIKKIPLQGLTPQVCEVIWPTPHGSSTTLVTWQPPFRFPDLISSEVGHGVPQPPNGHATVWRADLGKTEFQFWFPAILGYKYLEWLFHIL